MRIPDLETILEAAEWAAADLEQRHDGCDLDTSIACKAEQYADGVPSEHVLLKRFSHALSEVER